MKRISPEMYVKTIVKCTLSCLMSFAIFSTKEPSKRPSRLRDKRTQHITSRYCRYLPQFFFCYTPSVVSNIIVRKNTYILLLIVLTVDLVRLIVGPAVQYAVAPQLIGYAVT